MTASRFLGALVFLAVGLLSGACATTRYTQSGIGAASPDGEERAGRSASVEIEGLKLAIQTLDRTPEETPLRRLALRIEFEPRELGYSFDPGQVVLRTADGREWHAAGGRYLPVYPKAAFDIGFDVATPSGTYFANADIRPLGFDDDVEFCRMIPERVGVAAVPLSAFLREGGPRHMVRFAFPKDVSTLDEAVHRLRGLRG